MFDDFMTDESLSGPFNMTAPNPVTNREFVKAIGKAINRPVLMRIPAPIYRLIFGEVAHLHLTGQRVMPSRHSTRAFEFLYPTLREALVAALKS
jgi:NAD dependent epimerase/dehydratase family enzyme